jgi:hypothetical protein
MNKFKRFLWVAKHNKPLTILYCLSIVSIVFLFWQLQHAGDLRTYQYLNKQSMPPTHNLSGYGNNQGCTDNKGTSYRENTRINHVSNGFNLSFVCDKHGVNEHQWLVTKLTVRPIDHTVTFKKFCFDRYNNRYNAGAIIEIEKSFTCTQKNKQFYWRIL